MVRSAFLLLLCIAIWIEQSLSAPLPTAVPHGVGKCFSITTDGKKPIHTVSIAPDGRTFIIATEGGVQLRDAANGKLLSAIDGPQEPSIRCARYSQSGSYISAGSHGAISVLDSSLSKCVSRTTFEDDRIVTSLRFVPKTESLVFVDDSGRVSLYDFRMHKIISEATPRAERIQACDLSTDGHTIALTYHSSRLIIWDIAADSKKLEIDLGLSWGKCVAFSYDQRLVAVGCNDGSIAAFDLKTGKTLGIIRKNDARSVNSIEFDEDSKRLIVGCGSPAIVGKASGSLEIWALQEKKIIMSVECHDALCTCASICPDGTSAISVGYQGSLNRHNLDEFVQTSPLKHKR
jgi:WD40 repeat protein